MRAFFRFLSSRYSQWTVKRPRSGSSARKAVRRRRLSFDALEERRLLAVTYKAMNLGTLPGCTNSDACAINDSGQVVGQAWNASGVDEAVLWQPQTTTETLLMSSAKTSVYGQPVTFTATVTPTSSSSAVPTATFSTSIFAVGTHNITASYGGNGVFNGSVWTVFPQVVSSPTSAPLAFEPFDSGSLVASTLDYDQPSLFSATSLAPSLNDAALLSLIGESNGNEWIKLRG